MDNDEAIRVLEFELDHFRLKADDDVVARIGGEPVTYEKPGGSGATYQLEFEFFWDDEPNGAARVMGSVDDGGWRSFLPVTRSIIKTVDR
jgi:hypothetical protein